MFNPFAKLWEKVQQRATKIVAERLNRDVESYHLRVTNNMENLKRILKSGDVILVEGNKLVSRVVMAVTHSTWSHSALYIGDGKIIDPTPATGTVINNVNVYEQLNIRVCRSVGLTSDQLQKVCDFAVSHQGRLYDHINITNLLFAFFKQKEDQSEFIGDISSSNEVCSGLIAEAYNSIGFQIIDGVNFSRIVPAHFDLSPCFRIIKFNYVCALDNESAREWNAFIDESAVPLDSESS